MFVVAVGILCYALLYRADENLLVVDYRTGRYRGLNRRPHRPGSAGPDIIPTLLYWY